MHRILPVFLILALGACVPGFAGFGGGKEPKDGLTRQVTLPGSQIVVAGPAGYCLDPQASGLSDPTAFAAFRRCEVLRGEEYPLVRRGLLTVSVSGDSATAPVVAGAEARLISFFGTDAGRKALSRSSDAKTVTVLQVFAKDGAVWLQVKDTSPAQQLDPTYWRALFDLKGRIVTATVARYADGPLGDAAAKALLDELVGRLRAVNAAGAAPVAEAPAAEASAEESPTRSATGPFDASAGALLMALPRE